MLHMWTAPLFLMDNAVVCWLKLFDITLCYTSHANILKQLRHCWRFCKESSMFLVNVFLKLFFISNTSLNDFKNNIWHILYIYIYIYTRYIILLAYIVSIRHSLVLHMQIRNNLACLILEAKITLCSHFSSLHWCNRCTNTKCRG